MKGRLTATLLLSLPLLCDGLHAQTASTITEAELVRRTQELFDAVAPGNRAPWKRYIADDAMMFDEQGHDMNKSTLIDGLQPMPAGYSGSIKIANAKSRFALGVAILSYDGDETETVFGQVLHARYHMTDTWLFRSGHWQIAASQTLRYYEDPVAGQVSETLLNDYVGAYQIAPGNVVTITRTGNELYAQRGPGKPYKLLPESVDLFFRPGAEGRRLFHRDASGRVDWLIDRRNNEDLIWKKTS